MSLTQRERLLVHVFYLSKSHDKLEMDLGTAINIIINNRCGSITRKEILQTMRDCTKELSRSNSIYDEHEIN